MTFLKEEEFRKLQERFLKLKQSGGRNKRSRKRVSA